MFIPYTDTLLIAGTTIYDEDTGEAILGDDFSVPARIIYESHLVCNKQGDQIVAAIKIYLPPETQINENSILKIGEKQYKVITFEQKKDLSGRISHYVIYC